jgi:hypothetical protein
VWLTQRPTQELAGEAGAIADMLGLPLTVVPTTELGLERELERLFEGLALPTGS